MAVLILTEAELRRCVSIDEAALATVGDAFTWLAQGKVEMPPIMHIEIADHNGDVDIKSAYVRGLDGFAVKLASGFFDNPELGLPSGSGMVVLFSAKTGRCESVLLDNGYLTDLRTGLAGAVAAQHLAPSKVATVGIVGAGVQARYQLLGLRLVRAFERVLVNSRDAAKAQAYCQEMQAQLGVPVLVVDTIEQLVRQSQVIVTTTPAREPLIEAQWLQPGSHVTAMGSDLAGKQELAPKVLALADILVCDSIAQCAGMGELQHALASGVLVDTDTVLELGEITSGARPGRETPTQITVCDLTGTGVQDTAIALAAVTRARELGLGTAIES